MQKITGIIAPTPTFLDDKGNIDVKANIEVCTRLSKTKIGGFYILGTTGEFAYFSETERKNYVEELLENLKIDKPIIVCVSHWNTDRAIDLAEHAISVGAKLLAALLPLYYPISDTGIKEYYHRIRKSINEHDASIPLFLYHIPLITASATIKPEIILELIEDGTIQGMKETSFDITLTKQVLEKAPKDFKYLAGAEPLVFEAYRDKNLIQRMDGAILTGANLLPNTYNELFKAQKSLDEPKVNKYILAVSAIAGLYSQKISYMPQITKFGMKLLGYNVNDKVCDPVETLPDKMKKKVEKALTQFLDC
jgi:dihydrodipicolinate synthase/N-acetylneuraminate lyase